MGPPGPNDNSNIGTPSYVWGLLTKPLITSVHVCACACTPYLYIETSSYIFSEDGRLLSYCHRRSKKKFGFSDATVLFFKNQIGDGYYYRPQWRYSGSIASEKITTAASTPLDLQWQSCNEMPLSCRGPSVWWESETPFKSCLLDGQIRHFPCMQKELGPAYCLIVYFFQFLVVNAWRSIQTTHQRRSHSASMA